MSERDIPEPIKRQVRQHCHFGCAICGMPFFQYDHVQEYSEVREHSADNIVLLCPNHHALKTTRKLSREQIINARNAPYNATRQFTTGLHLGNDRDVICLLGTNEVACDFQNSRKIFHAVGVNGKPFFLLHSENGGISVSLRLTDDKGNLILDIFQGELRASTSLWDFNYVGEKIKIRRGRGDIVLDFNFTSRKAEVLKGAFMDTNGDGFIVEGENLITVIQGKRMSFSSYSRARNSFGGWGILNSIDYPNVPHPGQGGFNFFRLIE